MQGIYPYEGIPWDMPSPSSFPDLLALVKWGPNPDIGPDFLFLKWVGSASLGLGVQYSPIFWGGQSPWHPRFSIPSLPSDFEEQSDDSRMESNDGSQAFQVVIT